MRILLSGLAKKNHIQFHRVGHTVIVHVNINFGIEKEAQGRKRV